MKMGNIKNGKKSNSLLMKWTPHWNSHCKTCELVKQIRKGGKKQKLLGGQDVQNHHIVHFERCDIVHFERCDEPESL